MPVGPLEGHSWPLGWRIWPLGLSGGGPGVTKLVRYHLPPRRTGPGRPCFRASCCRPSLRSLTPLGADHLALAPWAAVAFELVRVLDLVPAWSPLVPAWSPLVPAGPRGGPDQRREIKAVFLVCRLTFG